MLPRRLKLTNFMGHACSDIDFTEFSCCLILGINKNNPNISNGCGKSTVFKAIDYVIFDEYPTKQAEKIIRDGESVCEVVFEFELNNDIYQVIRGRSKSGPFMYLNKFFNGKWDSLTERTNSQTQKELLKLLKISYIAFKHSILFAQTDLDGIPFASSDKRKELLKEPLQIAVYTKYHKLAKKKLDDAVKDSEVCDNLIKSFGDPEKDLKEIDDKLIIINQKYVDAKFFRDSNIKILDEEKSKLIDLKRKVDLGSVEINNQLIEVKKNKNQLKKEIELVKNEITNISEKLNNYKTKLVEKLDNFQSKKDKLKKAESEQFRNLEEIKNEINLSLKKEHQGRVFIATLQSKKNIYEKPIPDNGECTQCFQPIVDHKACVDRANNLLLETLKNIDTYANLLKKCEAKTKKLQEEYDAVLSNQNLINSLKMDIVSWESNIKTDQESISQFEEFVIAKKIFLDKSLSNLEILSKREMSLNELLQQSNLDKLNSQIYDLEIKINNIQEKLNNNISEISSIDTMLGVLDERKNQKKSDIEKINELKLKKKNLNNKISLQQRIVKAFSSGGIPSLIINTILDDLQIEVNNILNQIRPSIQCKFMLDDVKDTWDIIYYIYGKERDPVLISGGQQVYISLSFKLALSRIIQRRFGVDIRFLELDEVDRSLDDAGIEAFADIIKQWSKEFKVLVITHNPLLRTKFDHFIIVEGDDSNGSKAYYSNKFEVL